MLGVCAGTVAREPQFAEVTVRSSHVGAVRPAEVEPRDRYAASGMGAWDRTWNASTVTSATTPPAM